MISPDWDQAELLTSEGKESATYSVSYNEDHVRLTSLDVFKKILHAPDLADVDHLWSFKSKVDTIRHAKGAMFPSIITLKTALGQSLKHNLINYLLCSLG